MSQHLHKISNMTSSMNLKSDAERCQLTMSSEQTTSEISTNTSNIHLIARVRVQIDSSLQGHLKTLTKLTRGIERATHHSQLLQTAVDT